MRRSVARSVLCPRMICLVAVAPLLLLLSSHFVIAQNTEPTPPVQAIGETPRPVPHPLSYVEATNGLSSPMWDGGRSELEFADLNLDSHLDLVTVGDHGSPYINTQMHGITVWFGDGNGQWTVYQNGRFGYGGIAIGDVNNDGLPDAGWGVHHNYSGTDFGDQLIEVALGDGTGRNWVPWDDNLGMHGQTWGMFGTEFADIDCDGWLDLGSTSFGSGNGVHFYQNNRDGTWDWIWASTGGNSRMDIATGDVNNDGFPDFVTAIENGTVWLNDQNNGFILADKNLPGGGSLGRPGPGLGDVNNDGYDDISFVNSNGGIEVWGWNAATEDWSDLTGGLPAVYDFQVTQLEDMNSDGLLDVVAFGNRIGAVFVGDGAGNWALAATFQTPGPGDYEAFRIADADHNGYPDIAVLSDQGGIFSSRNKLQFFKETSTPRRNWIRVVHPVKHRVLKQGAVAFIDWVAAVADSSVSGDSRVGIEIAYDGAAGPWVQLATDLPNNSRHQFHVPADRTSTDCYLRLTLTVPNADPVSGIHGPFTVVQ
jgi:hypothetical protein